MFPDCTVQYDTKQWGDVYVFVEKQSLAVSYVYSQNKLIMVDHSDSLHTGCNLLSLP